LSIDKRKKKDSRRVRVGVDTGGTFTDFIYAARGGDGRLRIFKLASTPADPSRAISEGLRHRRRVEGQGA